MSPRTPQRAAVEVTERELAESLPAIAARMREIALLPRNHLRITEGDSLLGRVVVTTDEEGHKTRTRIRRSGLVPVKHLTEDDQAKIDTASFRDESTLVEVPDLRRYLTYRYRLVEHRSVMSIIFAVEKGAGLTDLTPDGRSEAVRHLSLQFTVPGRIGRGEIVRHQEALAEANEWLVVEFLPAAKLGVPIAMKLASGEPWEVVDPDAPRAQRVLHYKTPVVMDFVMDHDLADRRKPQRKVQLFGPNGRPV